MAKKEVAKNGSKVKVFEEDEFPVGEFTSAYIGGISPFGPDAKFPMQLSKLNFEHSAPVPPRILDDERH